eukprot:m.47957 g.47957  ORF g.47957 m.47957 type:complete len:350 (+) comp11958_c0_seq2:175-1224(+)
MASAAAPRVASQPPPDVDPTKARLAFGNRSFPKLNRELQSDDLQLKHQALTTLCDELRAPQNIAQALREGVITSLKTLLADPDNYVREKTTEALVHTTGHAQGRQAVLDEALIEPLAKLFDDPSEAIRTNVQTVFQRTTASVQGAEALVTAQLVPVLVGKLPTETPSIQVLILETLHNGLKVDTETSLVVNSMDTYIALVTEAKVPAVYAAAARNILDLSVPLEGKRQAVAKGAVPALVALLRNGHAEARAAAASGLMSITITTEGKKAALAADAPSALIALLDDPNESVKLNTIKAVSSIAEDPAGRAAFFPAVQKLHELCSFRGTKLDPQVIARNADRAVKTVTWKP